ncbi:MAG TPA: helix-turn-helix domain-containing protein [Candidatus Binatia bacterium]|nr:helix-turn-helix domain-containing protein [Candidatus Binatia bacterium]
MSNVDSVTVAPNGKTAAFPNKRAARLKRVMALALLNDGAMENEFEPMRFLTINQAAELLQVSKRTLERMIHDKKFPAFKVGGQWRVRESQLNKWIKDLDEL